MTERTSKILRTIMAAAMLALFGGIYYRLGLIEDEDLTWQLWVALGLMIPAGWLLIWRMSLRRRIVALILWGALCAIVFYGVDLITSSWILMWMPIMLGVAVLAVTVAMAFFPSHGRDAADRRSQ